MPTIDPGETITRAVSVKARPRIDPALWRDGGWKMNFPRELVLGERRQTGPGTTGMRLVVGLCAAAAVAVLYLGGSPAAATAGVLDQSQETQTDLNGVVLVGSQVAAQTFTAGRTGALDQVDVLLTRYGAPGELAVAIHASEGGAPTSHVLASGTVLDTSLDSDPYTYEWASVALSPTPLVQQGTQYAIVLRDAGGAIFPSDYFVWGSAVQGNPYASGEALTSVDGGLIWYSASDVDFAFRTYVVPAPPTSTDQCKNDGWRTFGIFNSQGECVSYVKTH